MKLVSVHIFRSRVNGAIYLIEGAGDTLDARVWAVETEEQAFEKLACARGGYVERNAFTVVFTFEAQPEQIQVMADYMVEVIE